MYTSGPVTHKILIAGANGYLGSRLAERLLARGHAVTAFVRSSASRVPKGCFVVFGDALNEASYADAARGSDTIVHLVGVAHPSPSKAAQFKSIDLASAKTAAVSATSARVSHIVYISVARPAPVMHAYMEARCQAEEAFRATAIPCTFLQPWYVVGPGHYWPVLILPIYKLFEVLPSTRETAERLGLVGVETMLRCLVRAIENPPQGETSPVEVRIWDVPTLRRLGSAQTPAPTPAG